MQEQFDMGVGRIQFREHRGLLKDSMATVIRVNTRDELLMYLTPIVAPIPLTAERLNIEYYTFDDRIGWETYIVTVMGYGVVGFTDGPI